MLTRPVGHPVPTAGEDLPWASAVQPRCPTGELGYGMKPSSVKCAVIVFDQNPKCDKDSVCVRLLLYLFAPTCALYVFQESQWKEKQNAEQSSPSTEAECISQEHIETLSHICRTHNRYIRWDQCCKEIPSVCWKGFRNIICSVNSKSLWQNYVFNLFKDVWEQ